MFTQETKNVFIVLASIICLLSVAKLSCGADVLHNVNVRRSYLGLPPFIHDPRLTQLAERESNIQASRGRMGHYSGCPSPARGAGVGYTSYRDPTGRRFQSCYAATRKYRYAGASAVVGRNGRTYYTLMLR